VDGNDEHRQLRNFGIREPLRLGNQENKETQKQFVTYEWDFSGRYVFVAGGYALVADYTEEYKAD
jgi:hypothetical protein